MSINIVPQDFLQQQCDNFIRYYSLETVMNDYNPDRTLGPVQTNAVHDLFEIPFSKPHFLVLNCVSNSTQNPLFQVMLTEDAGIGDFSPDGPAVARWRGAIDTVQAPLPQITSAGFLNGAFQFTFPGQRGRTNQVLCTSNLVNWTLLTNAIGTNWPILFRDGTTSPDAARLYRIRRL